MPNRARTAALSTVLVTLALILSACSSSSGGSKAGTTASSSAASGGTSAGTAPSSPATSSTPPPAPKTTVHIKTLNSDGATYGVGMPIIVFLQHRIKSATAFAQATKVTVNGKPQVGDWYFEGSSYLPGYPIEAHWRPQQYWTAHSKVHLDLPVKGVSGGGDFVFDNSLTLDFNIGASHVGVVNDVGTPHTLTITSDGTKYGTFPVSLGAPNTRTLNGTKVIMEKGVDIPMRGPGYYDAHVKFTQRLTYGGEYLHAAPWNCTDTPGCTGPANNINTGVDSSNGCTNLRPVDAARLYHFLEVGDVIEFPNATGPRMQMGQGYGDWNVPWGVWQQGGLISTT